MHRIRFAAVIALALCVTFFVVLALDVMVRLWEARAGFGSGGDVVLLLVLEAVRAVVTVSFVAVAVVAARRGERGHTAFAVALLFFALWYVKFVSFGGYPGDFQQWLARRLKEVGASPDFLRLVFGRPLWALAPGAAAFLMFATQYPQAPRPETVRAVHATGRRGMMRDVALAGMDVRSLIHHAAARALSHGLASASAVGVIAAGGFAMLAFGGPWLRGLGIAALVSAFGFACAYLRTAFVAIDGPHRKRLRHLGLAGGSLALELVVCGMLAFLPGGALARMALALAAAAPLGALYFLIAFIRAVPDAQHPHPAMSAESERFAPAA